MMCHCMWCDECKERIARFDAIADKARVKAVSMRYIPQEQYFATMNKQKKFTVREVREMRARHTAGETMINIALSYPKASVHTVRQAIAKRSYKQVTT